MVPTSAEIVICAEIEPTPPYSAHVTAVFESHEVELQRVEWILTLADVSVTPKLIPIIVIDSPSEAAKFVLLTADHAGASYVNARYSVETTVAMVS